MTVVQPHASDETGFGIALDLGNFRIDPRHATLEREILEEGGIERRIELIGVAIGMHRRTRIGIGREELASPGQLRRQAVGLKRRGIALIAQVAPVVIGGNGVDIGAEIAETVKEAMALAAPADELDAELEGGLTAADEIELVDAEMSVVVADGRQGRLPHPDRADGFGFDQGDADRLRQGDTEVSRAHIAGGTAAGDDDMAHGWLHAVVPVGVNLEG